MNLNRDSRRPKLMLASFDNNYLRVMNPFMPLWWGLAMPGSGHIMIGKYIKGIVLFVWEFFINSKAHLNLSIFYTCTGQFELAKSVIDLKWFFIYIPVYVFNAWDAYRLTTDTNQFSMLAVKNKSHIRAFNLSPLEINYLQKLNVWIPVIWSVMTPGLGHIIIRNLIPGIYVLGWFVTVVYQSNLLLGIYHTAIGDFDYAIQVMDIQWAMFLPSVYLFAICDSYYRATEINQLFKIEQKHYLEENYCRRSFKLFGG